MGRSNSVIESDTRSAQAAIEDYALIGDCRTAALVSRSGSIDWLCLPHYSSPAIFAALLDRSRGGCCSIQPGGRCSSERRYCGDTPILETTARSFLTWLLHATRLTWPRLQVVYDVYGRTRLREHEIERLDGYSKSRPVRVGNGAWSQTQLDVYGEVILAADAFVTGGGVLETADESMLKGFGRVVCRLWREPDHGIWEVRGGARQYTFSKVMCWLALDRLIKLHEKKVMNIGSLDQTFRREREAIGELIERRAFNQNIASYTGELGGGTVDASLLLMTCLGYKRADDPRMVSTYERIRERLGCNGRIQTVVATLQRWRLR
jgi:GH15 family glucan-1,4-alpha-glucosidase